MNGITFIILLALVLIILGLIYIICYNALQNYFGKVNEVESKIDSSLRERYDLLCKAADFIKENINEEVMEELSDLQNKDLSSFDFERKLASITREFYDLKFIHRKLIKLDDFTNMDFSLRENEAEVDGYTAYYNDNVAKFNNLIRMFPSNIVAKLARFKEKTFYDGKNMNDNKIDDFKL
jgi:LemA protein